MTTIDQTTITFQRLIESCQQAQHQFRRAAEMAESENLKRLLEIYAHQRTRFADELQKHLPELSKQSDAANEKSSFNSAKYPDPRIFAECMAAEIRALDIYKEALASHMPRKAQFLVAAQYSLMQRVHDRILSTLRGINRNPEFTAGARPAFA